MAFDIMSLFGPSAVNRMLQPAQNANGVQNFLANPQAAQTQVDPWAGMRQPQVDQMPVAATQPVAQQTGQTGGFGGIDKAMLNDIFLGWAMGQTPMQSLSLGAAQASKGKSSRTAQNDTVKWLTGKGLDSETARMVASDPQTLQKYLTDMVSAKDPMKDLQRQKMELEISNLQNPQAKLTDDQREYQAARDQGFQGSFMDYMVKMKEAGRQQVNIDTGEKLPSGFRWINPDKRELGVEPIPGGPGEQISGELAARIGMADSFLGQAPALRDRLTSGDMTGPIDSLAAQFGYGHRGETYRQLQSGTDALMRLLTGAGMNETEARAYAERYLPTMKDSPESAAGKLDQLIRELEATKGVAMRGRGGKPETLPGGANKPITEMSDQELEAIVNGRR